jgi:transcriptional antiterminator RfaH
MTATTELDWYVVQTHINSENKAVFHLQRQGYSVYLPRYLKRRSHARRIETVPAPLFPRYLFVSADENARRWRAIQSTIGVSRIVCNGDKPATAAAAVVSRLKLREGEDGLVRLDRRVPFVPGDKVQVMEGVFSESFGLFESMTDHERVSILLDLLGRKVRIVLHEQAIAAA